MLLDGRQYQFITLFQFPGVFQYRPKIRGRCYRFQLDKASWIADCQILSRRLVKDFARIPLGNDCFGDIVF